MIAICLCSKLMLLRFYNLQCVNFAGMHGRIFLLVVLVERGLLFHIEKYFVGFIFHKEPSFSADKE